MKYKGKITDDLDLIHAKWGKNNLVQKVSAIPTTADVPLNSPFMWIGEPTPYGEAADFFTYGRFYKLTDGDPAIVKIAGVDGITDVTVDGSTVVEDDTAKIKTDQKTIKNGDAGLTVNNAKELWDLIYPVGSVYISISENPNTKFTGTTWVQITGCTLWGTASGGGGYLDAQLPKLPSITCNSAGAHTHTVSGSRTTGYYVPSGSYYGKDETVTQTTSSSGSHTHSVSYGTSSVYGTSSDTTVRPTSYAVMFWKRTA